jgi:DNA-binding FadR family transcriptional regulator
VSSNAPTDASPARRTPKARFRSLGRKNDLVETVVNAIESEIFAGRLVVSARLPPERELSERLGVSRTVLREAVRILVTKGLLETRHGFGTTVRAVTRQKFIEPLTLFLHKGRRQGECRPSLPGSLHA